MAKICELEKSDLEWKCGRLTVAPWSGDAGWCGARAPFVPGAVNVPVQSMIPSHVAAHKPKKTAWMPPPARLWDGGRAACAYPPYCRPHGSSCMCGDRCPHVWPDGMEPGGCMPPLRTLLWAAFVMVCSTMKRKMLECRIRAVPEWNSASRRRCIVKDVDRQYAGHSSAFHPSLESADTFSNLATSCFGLIFSGDETRSLAYAIYSFFVS